MWGILIYGGMISLIIYIMISIDLFDTFIMI